MSRIFPPLQLNRQPMRSLLWFREWGWEVGVLRVKGGWKFRGLNYWNIGVAAHYTMIILRNHQNTIGNYTFPPFP